MDLSRPMRHLHLFHAAVGDLVRRPARLFLLVICLATAVFPLSIALGVSEGVKNQAETSLREGADIFVSSDVYGAEGPVPLIVKDRFAALPGVVKARPRVVGRTYFGGYVAAVLGLDEEGLTALGTVVDGRVPAAGGEVLVGRALAESSGVKAGMKFTLTANRSKLFTVVGTLQPADLWASDVLVMSLADANEFFSIDEFATQILLFTERATEPAFPVVPGLRLHRRTAYERTLRSGFSWDRGIFSVLLVVAAGLAVPALLVISGLGRREVRCEFGILKAVGWTSREIVEKSVLENLVTSLMAASFAVVLCVVWMKGLNGLFIGQFFVAEVGLVPRIQFPFQFLPVHGIVCLAFVLLVTETGGLYAAWTGSRIPPAEAMKR